MTSARPIFADYAPDLYRYHTEAQQVARFADIDPEQLAFFHQQGYLAIAEAFPPIQVAAATAAVYDLIRRQTARISRRPTRSLRTGPKADGYSAAWGGAQAYEVRRLGMCVSNL